MIARLARITATRGTARRFIGLPLPHMPGERTGRASTRVRNVKGVAPHVVFCVHPILGFTGSGGPLGPPRPPRSQQTCPPCTRVGNLRPDEVTCGGVRARVSRRTRCAGRAEHSVPGAARLTRTTNDGWHRATGRNGQKLLQLAARDLANPICYVRGTPSMVVGMLRLLRGLDVPDSNIEVEAFRG